MTGDATGAIAGDRVFEWVDAETLCVGDVVEQGGVVGQVVEGPVAIAPHEEFFGRAGHFKFRCRADDGREGWMRFGPGGKAHREKK